MRKTGARPEFIRDVQQESFGIIEKPLPWTAKAVANPWLRKVVLLLVLASAWELYATLLNNPFLMPRFSATMQAFYENMANGTLFKRGWVSVRLLLVGYGAGILAAAVLAAFASVSHVGKDFLETLTAMFNPLPAIALLPLAMIWFGLGHGSLVFVLIHSVLWPVALNTHSGFLSVSNTLRMVGRNCGLTSVQLIWQILIPAAFPNILSGLKIGWAFAWRTLIAAELVFGATAGSGGLGWFIYENKNQLEIPNVFAGLFSVILIGLLVENILFRNIEARTIRRWGMQA